ncbi:MAG: 2-phosphosulfolactate phosphatase [Flavobacteriales bacterium]|nr:2-phosphosulfolactate phosphatase [Flavobacteriales bacterium]MBK6945258.1 2-phosphosulfolactate phosphatase [Flavobacteriales bacterium]MBK7239609.1 2-phosphosulfolactate phosphatase [Flavobacteriales bacterium]MBK9535185.1 2-phosphosulfolactate phosphatase [Flavobacteriales bacterium]MBP9137839.1 2-phosphosulfolactate phosphatase [Flavobacteriales bacterium]
MADHSNNVDYKYRVEVCFTPGQYPLYAEDMGIVVVIDILRATSAMVAAFDNGVEKIIPVSTIEEARKFIGKPGYIAAAERDGEIVEGFSYGNSPLAYIDEDLTGKTIVMTTTNGTKAINLAMDARLLVIGSFLNLTALTDWLLQQNDNILLLCSGWKDKFNLEDSVFAGAVMDRLLESGKFGVEEDSSIAAKYMYLAAKENVMGILKAAPRRRRIDQLKMHADVKYCLTQDQCNVIPVLRNGELVRLETPVPA